MLQVKSVRDYVSKKGNDTFVYEVSGDKTAMAAYKKAQGEYYREDDKTGVALWFTTRFIGDSGKLIITTNGNVVADMSEFRKAESLSSQYGGNLGQELARTAAASLFGGSASSEGLDNA
tara:strand:+ start:1942 stop:2298 length:357 start_codon:yes stop_codon:yes gene_type:complete